ncbi:unnamed protein product [Caenorhabditis angaria]|uniref:Origin recognition complex subunit 1 n=1 Tax=Caenorhabditis angaria TaxID=860376 RepID=A0A9P1MY70_9PELO|nr:unnamed protein product [Caenorhabditis angaria]
MDRRSSLRPRKSEISQIVSATPQKSPGRQPKGRRAPASSKQSIVFKNEASESSSSEDDSSDSDSENQYKNPVDPSLEEEDLEISDIFLENSSDKENSPGRRRSQKINKNLANLSLKASEPQTPSRNTRSSMKGRDFYSLSDQETDSEEMEMDIEIKRVQTRSARRALAPITPKKATTKKGVTPTRLAVSKTPGGTRSYNFATRTRKQETDSNHRSPIAKLRLTLPGLSTIAQKMKNLADKLHLSEIPENLPCREKETQELRKFIEQAVHPKKGESGAIYISGVPGTGKTATVRAVIESMKSSKSFVYAEVNAMIFRKKVFAEIYNRIQENYTISAQKTPKKQQLAENASLKIASSTARLKLNAMFRKADKNRSPIVILVDELDGLCNRKQDVLYDIFDWTSMPEARVTIIAIANTLDFPERMLCQRISSRLDKRRLIFQPYEHEQIERIIDARLAKSEVIDPNAVKLVARKVSAISGDLRQALDMLRRSIRIAIEMKSTKLTMEHVNLAQKAVAEPLKMRLIKSLKLHKLMIFRAVLTIIQSTEKEETIFSEVYKMYCVLCQTLSGVAPTSDSLAYDLALQLARTSLLILSPGQNGMFRRKIKLGMAVYEAEKCIQQIEELQKSH